MSTRREFLAGAGLAFCSCALLDGARAQQPARPRLPVMVNGKRVKTVDVHAHCQFRDAVTLMGEQDAARIFAQRTRGVENLVVVIEQRLKAMDAMAIDMEVLSINPVSYTHLTLPTILRV